MRTLVASVATALAQPDVRLVQLINMQLTAPLLVNTSSWDLTWAGQTYLGVAGAGRIDTVDDQPGELKGLNFELSGVPSSMLALVLSEPVQGKLVTIYTAIFDANCQILDAVVEWAGRLDVMTIAESGQAAVVTVSAEHIGIDLLRPGNSRFSNQDQQRLYPGDAFFEYVVDQADQQIIWPAASYFRQ